SGMLLEDMPDLGRGAIRVVSERFDDDGDAAGTVASYVTSSYVAPSSSPVPRLMARSMLSFGMLFAFASATAARRRGLPSASPPPSRAAMVISLMMRVKTFPRFASGAPFLCLMVLHLLWPDMGGCSFG